MKRRGYVIEEIADLDNLYLAFYKAQKGKRHKKEVYVYGKSLTKNLLSLRQQILSGNVTSGNYNLFTIYDPKERVICAAPFAQRVMHHSIMNICHDDFEKKQIYDSYASVQYADSMLLRKSILLKN